VLTWRVNELWGTDWGGGVAVITVVAQVTDNVGANLILTNTAAIPVLRLPARRRPRPVYAR
jgi:hypothetical protein